MLQNIALFMVSSRVMMAITQNLNGMAGFFQRYLAGTDNLRVVSIILLLLAFVLFLFLIVILYIKSLLNFIRDETSSSGNEIRSGKVFDHLSKEQELERELAIELEKSQQRKAESLRMQKNLQEEQQRQKNAEAELKKNSKRKRNFFNSSDDNLDITDAFTDYRVSAQPEKKPFAGRMERGIGGNADFDWRGGAQNELDSALAGVSPFQYQTAKIPLSSTAGLILNMLSRNIDPGKIAQVIKSKCEDDVKEEDIIQFIDSIRGYVTLCNNGKLAAINQDEELPTLYEALYELAYNDPTYCLNVLQSLMNHTINRVAGVKIPQKRDLGFMEASHYACMFGTLASMFDQNMALSTYEIAIEFSPKNVNAWSRVGDMYARTQADSKAIWAYQNVLKMADETHHLHQIANANKHLAQYYYDQGDTGQATKLYNSSQDYYESIGINQPLTNNEKEVVKLIEAKQAGDIPDAIARLLKISAQNQRGYA